MQEEKSFVYTLILGICMLLCLLMIGRMLLGHPEQNMQPGQSGPSGNEQEDTQMGLQLSEADLCGMITQALPFTPDHLAVQISEDEIISVDANVRRQDLLDSGLIPGNLRTALLFLPESCKISGAWTVTLQNNVLSLQCAQAEIAGFSLPDEVVNVLSEEIGNAINRKLAENQLAPTKLQWENGMLSLTV